MLDDATLRMKRLGQKELSADSVQEISRAKAVRASYEFWSTGNEALLEQAFAETFAEHAARPHCEPATNGFPPSPRRRAPENDAK
jgi:membrane-bound inhibitor of C-type lysozyme